MKAIESAWAASAAMPDAALRGTPVLDGLRATPFLALARFGRWTAGFPASSAHANAGGMAQSCAP
jgi:hypothetical protein